MKLVLRGIFDRNWQIKAQYNIDSIKNSKNFWYLMSQKINAEKVFQTYLRTRNQKDHIRVGDCSMFDFGLSKNELGVNDFNINTITEDDSVKIINIILNPKIEEREKDIVGFLIENKFVFTEEEIRKAFKEYFRAHSQNVEEVQRCFDQFMETHLDYFIRCDEKTGIGIWKVLKGFSDRDYKFEFDYSGKRVDILNSLKLLQNDIKSFVLDLFCSKLDDEKSIKIITLFKEWQHLNMLRWCVIDFSLWEIGKNKIQISLWHCVNFLFL